MSKTYTLKTNQSRTISLDKAGDYTVKLAGEGAQILITSRAWIKGVDTFNFNLTLIHAAPNTSAQTSIKAVVEGRGQANILGTIIVQKNAQNTNSFLEERVLLLGDKARATAVPNLEIEANQVKCSHAATVGRINEEELFYLQSRGLPQKKATYLIAQGFLK